MNSPSMDEAATKEELRPVKKQLVSVCLIFNLSKVLTAYVQKQLKLSGGDMPRDSKVAILKESLAAIGRRIDYVLETKRGEGEDVDRWRRHLWWYVSPFLRPHHSLLITRACLSTIMQFRHPILAKTSQSVKTRRDPREDGDEGGRCCTAAVFGFCEAAEAEHG